MLLTASKVGTMLVTPSSRKSWSLVTYWLPPTMKLYNLTVLSHQNHPPYASVALKDADWPGDNSALAQKAADSKFSRSVRLQCC